MSYEPVKQGPHEPAEKKTKCQEILNFIVDTKAGTFLGRTPKSWFLIFVFYVIYYILLSGFFVGMLSVLLYKFIEAGKPMYTGDNNILRYKAGLNINPRMDAVYGASMNINHTVSKEYVNKLNKFFEEEFPTKKREFGISNCKETPKDPQNFCIFEKKNLGPCEQPFEELAKGNICLYVRVNKVYGWVPDMVNKSISNDVLIECMGQYAPDVSNLGEVKYYPEFKYENKTYGLIQNMYFPYLNQKNYTSPMVAIQFPKMTKNLAILSRCKLFNLKNDYKHVNFDVMVMEPNIKL